MLPVNSFDILGGIHTHTHTQVYTHMYTGVYTYAHTPATCVYMYTYVYTVPAKKIENSTCQILGYSEHSQQPSPEIEYDSMTVNRVCQYHTLCK